jgi:hypothetical protein
MVILTRRTFPESLDRSTSTKAQVPPAKSGLFHSQDKRVKVKF